MATFRTRWLMSILLVNLPDCFAPAGLPAPPSVPDCCIPCTEGGCSADILCTWNSGSDPQVPTNYSLHWKQENSDVGFVTSRTKWSSSIYREHYGNHEDLLVWVEAKNQHGSVKSQEVVFNTADIKKPPPPNITLTEPEPLMIVWNSFCDKLELSMGTCNVRSRIKGDPDWFEHGGFQNTYTFEDSQPGTVYEVQVSCACIKSLPSEWSSIRLVKSAETAPVGQLDVWRDCGIFPASFDCVLTWKRLPISQAGGFILAYEVILSYSNDTWTSVNVSTAEPSSQLLCDETQCHLNFFLKDVSSVNVSALNACGATVPSKLTLLRPEKNEHAIDLKMNEENITVTWDLPSDSLKEYVVQYKQAGQPPGQGFGWVKVTKGQTTVSFKGQFKKYTPYLVSLLAVSNDQKVHQLASVVGYSFEGIPSRVPSFEVFSISATQVTLSWKPVPLSEQRGVIQYYQIGLDGQNVHNESACPQRENWTIELKGLSPDREYDVWIKAVTKAGPGQHLTRRFKTKPHEDYVPLILSLTAVVVVVIICLCLFLHCYCRGIKKVCPWLPSCVYEKVPDPRNSHIIRQMKHQINEPFAWICIPIHEPHPRISVLEVVEVEPGALKSSQKKTSDPDGLTRPIMGDGCPRMDSSQDDEGERGVTEDCGRTNHRYRREEYSKMVDSDEERDRGDCWSSSEEEQFTSGYEKHFMPTPIEILEG